MGGFDRGGQVSRSHKACLAPTLVSTLRAHLHSQQPATSANLEDSWVPEKDFLGLGVPLPFRPGGTQYFVGI